MTHDLTPALRTVFREALGLAPDAPVDELAYRAVPEWDSVAHMQLVNLVETTFDVMLDTPDVLGLSSFSRALEIVERHRGGRAA